MLVFSILLPVVQLASLCDLYLQLNQVHAALDGHSTFLVDLYRRIKFDKPIYPYNIIIIVRSTPHACARGKALVCPSIVVVVNDIVVVTKVARSHVLGICACCKHNKSVEKLISTCLKLLKMCNVPVMPFELLIIKWCDIVIVILLLYIDDVKLQV